MELWQRFTAMIETNNTPTDMKGVFVGKQGGVVVRLIKRKADGRFVLYANMIASRPVAFDGRDDKHISSAFASTAKLTDDARRNFDKFMMEVCPLMAELELTKNQARQLQHLKNISPIRGDFAQAEVEKAESTEEVQEILTAALVREIQQPTIRMELKPSDWRKSLSRSRYKKYSEYKLQESN